MTEQTNATSTDTSTDNNQATTTQGKRGPRRVRHRDEVRAEIIEDIAALQAKLDAMDKEDADAAYLANLAPSTAVKVVTGRRGEAIIEDGIVLGGATNEKGAAQLNILVGTGINSRTVLVGGGRVVPPGTDAEAFLAAVNTVVKKDAPTSTDGSTT